MSGVRHLLYIHALPPHFDAGVVPCLGSAMRSLSRQARAELEFTTLVGVVSEAIYEARQHHQLQQTGIKVCVHTGIHICLANFLMYIHVASFTRCL